MEPRRLNLDLDGLEVEVLEIIPVDEPAGELAEIGASYKFCSDCGLCLCSAIVSQ
jgi:hypothetical protein